MNWEGGVINGFKVLPSQVVSSTLSAGMKTLLATLVVFDGPYSSARSHRG
jgi:hypothetical protein